MARSLERRYFGNAAISCKRNLLLRCFLKLPRIKAEIVLRECESGAKMVKEEWDDGSDEGWLVHII